MRRPGQWGWIAHLCHVARAAWTSPIRARDSVGVWFEEDADPPMTGSPADQAAELLDRQAALLVSVATGGPPINSVNGRYLETRRLLLALLRPLGWQYPFPFADLWEWHGHYKQHLGTYAERRAYVSGLARDLRDALADMAAGVGVHDPGQPAPLGWSDLELRVSGLTEEFRSASSHDDLQDVGRRSREILIDVARLLADPMLVPFGQEPPKAADAKAWLDLFLETRAGGGGRKELRRFVRAAWDLAQVVTHSSVDRADTYAAAQATVLLVRTLQMLAADGSGKGG